jgi:hypothetical protein
MSRLRVGRAALPWSGGAYFRLIPYHVFRRGVSLRLRRQSWFMFYFHPWELDHDEAAPPNLPRVTRLRSYVGRRRMRADLKRLLAEFGSQRVDHALQAIGLNPPAASSDRRCEQ